MSPQELIAKYIRTDQRRDAKVAAMILRACPEYIEEEQIGDWLRRIGAGTVRRETVRGWLETAGVNPWRLGTELRPHQRVALARELDKFAQEGAS